MADLIDKTAAVQIMARVAAGRMRMKDAQDAIAALPEVDRHSQGVRVLTEAQIDAALDAMEAWSLENGGSGSSWRTDMPDDDKSRLRNMARVGILAALAPAEAGGVRLEGLTRYAPTNYGAMAPDERGVWVDHREVLAALSPASAGGVKPCAAHPNCPPNQTCDYCAGRVSPAPVEAQERAKALTELAQADAPLIDLEPHVNETPKSEHDAGNVLKAAPVDALVTLLKEARDDIAEYVNADYPEEYRAQYPDMDRRYMRDMELCRRIDAALAAYRGGAK